eukprot:CAMPEP_0170507526 /NCGR_PEP_ID=MMETSP0208-20121228/59138_1 /TAXON_ID=197538 /ORGANISM="Strombidium inclinatum, Strain S3" /LENGTH=43 /DNA_ID= /DNA_START= /DNA_END= /DNA_ORIENTATION=
MTSTPPLDKRSVRIKPATPSSESKRSKTRNRRKSPSSSRRESL